MPRPASENQKKMLDTDELLMLFVEKFPTVDAANKGGYADIYAHVVDWLYDHGGITSEDYDSLYE